MVGRLVEEQQVGRPQQQPAQRHAAALAARERRDVGVRRRQPQRVHRELDARVQVPAAGRLDAVLDLALLLEDLVHLLGRQILAEAGVDLVVAIEQRADLRDALLDVAEHGLRRVEPRLLLQEPDGRPLGLERFAEKGAILARHDPQQRALARSVQAEDADLRARQERQPDVLEDDVVGRMYLPEPFHGVDELWRHRGNSLSGFGARKPAFGVRQFIVRANADRRSSSRRPLLQRPCRRASARRPSSRARRAS